MEHQTLPSAPVLTRQELLEEESALHAYLHSILPFSAHALYFPRNHEPKEAEWLARERKVLLPLWNNEEFLGIFVMANVRARQAKPLLPALPALASVCLHAIASSRQSRLDPVTGLLRDRYLLQKMEQEADLVRCRMGQEQGTEVAESAQGHSSEGKKSSQGLHRLCMGLVTLRWGGMRDVIARHGYAFAEKMLHDMAQALVQDMPASVTISRSGSNEFCLLLPSSGRSACRQVAAAAIQRMEAVHGQDVYTRLPIYPRITAGHGLYPQDMAGMELNLPMFEQARLLLARARLAASTAADALWASEGRLKNCIFDYARLLQEGGIVRGVLPQERLRVSLGRQAGAYKGMRLSAWRTPEHDSTPEYMGELVLAEIKDSWSLAETSLLSDPTRPLQKGDSLRLITEENQTKPIEDPLTGLLSCNAFCTRLARECTLHPAFSLAIVRLAPQQDVVISTERHEALLAEAAQLWRHLVHNTHAEAAPAWGGRYGAQSLIFFHPHAEATQNSENLQALYTQFCQSLEQGQLDAAAGIATYPLLHFGREDMLSCAFKALDYALLLPKPHVGMCGTLALNISADRRYSQGDIFGAIEEYKLALLADENNAMAWNSLGVSVAALGRYEQAKQYFLEAVKRKPEDAAIYYNLGTLYQSRNDSRTAAKNFKLCLKYSPEHLYACLRLGQLAEAAGKRTAAQQYYSRAAQLEKAQPQGSVALRHLANLAIAQKKPGKARAFLHDALIKNPYDAAALRILAQLYLDAGEDPAMAEMLARKSISIQETAQGWHLLARALRALGREDDACGAETMTIPTGKNI